MLLHSWVSVRSGAIAVLCPWFRDSPFQIHSKCSQSNSLKTLQTLTDLWLIEGPLDNWAIEHQLGYGRFAYAKSIPNWGIFFLKEPLKKSILNWGITWRSIATVYLHIKGTTQTSIWRLVHRKTGNLTENTGKCKKILGNTVKCWKILGNAGKYWRCWEILGNVGKYWKILENIGKYWEATRGERSEPYNG